MPFHDPLKHPEPLIRRVYSYVAYRLGDGPDAEDVTSDVFERAVRYGKGYDPSRGEPIAWLLGIARRCVDEALAARPVAADASREPTADSLEEVTVNRLMLSGALSQLTDRERDLIALRFGADLTARQIGEIFGSRPNTVEVALHRALNRLRALVEQTEAEPKFVGPVRVERLVSVSGLERSEMPRGEPV